MNPSKANIILVEGSDDQHVIKALCGRHELGELAFPGNIKGGFEQLIRELPVFLEDSQISNVGIVVDADKSPHDRFQAVSNVLAGKGYNVPNELSHEGSLIEAPQAPPIRPRVGLWVMPDNKAAGELEHFLEALVPESLVPVFQYAKECVQGVPREGLPVERMFKVDESSSVDDETQKAVVRTFLAWQRDPGSPPGQSITKTYLDAESPLALRFVRWLKELYYL